MKRHPTPACRAAHAIGNDIRHRQWHQETHLLSHRARQCDSAKTFATECQQHLSCQSVEATTAWLLSLMGQQPAVIIIMIFVAITAAAAELHILLLGYYQIRLNVQHRVFWPSATRTSPIRVSPCAGRGCRDGCMQLQVDHCFLHGVPSDGMFNSIYCQ
jgi:hypothetical protein